MSDALLHRREETLRFRLKAATGALHRQTEDIFALETRIAARDTYRDLLIALYGFHAPLEEKLRAVDFGTSLDMSERLTKSAWIADDLEVLGVEREAVVALPRCTGLPDLASSAEALGALYVTEGATLGGQLIMRALYDRLGLTAETGGRFFASYGASIGLMWRRFVTALDDEGGDPGNANAAERTATATFRAFGDWLPPVPASAHD